MLCQECKKKPTCTELCAKAEKYVNQDHVALREIPLSDISLDLLSHHLKITPTEEVASYFTENEASFPFLTPLQNKLLTMFYFQGLSYTQIAMMTNRRVRTVESQLARARKKIAVFFSNNRGRDL